MPITLYQIIVPVLACIATLYAWNLVARRKKSIWEALLWTAFWGGLAAIAIWPSFIDILTTFTGIQDRENAVFITSLGVLFFVVFYMVIKIEELARRQHRFIRTLALKEFTTTYLTQ